MGQHGIYMHDLNLVDSLMKITTIFLNTAKWSISNDYDTYGPTLPCTLINPCPEECQFDMSE